MGEPIEIKSPELQILCPGSDLLPSGEFPTSQPGGDDFEIYSFDQIHRASAGDAPATPHFDR